MRPHLADGAPVVLCAKGIEHGTSALMTEVAAEALPQAQLAVLSGPTFAREVARDLPTAVTLACADETIGQNLVTMIGTAHFRPYLSDDLIARRLAAR